MLKIRHLCLKFPQKASVTQVYQHLSRYLGTPVSAIPNSLRDLQDISLETSNSSTETISKNERPTPTSKNSMVAAAFAALNSDKIPEEIKTPKTDERVKDAKSVEELLVLSEGTGVSRRLALKIVSVLADWCTAGKVQLSDFDKDPRFIRLCRILTKSKIKPGLSPRNEELSMVINITADDEAARLINSLTVSQMVKVIGMLASKKRRSVPLLRSISFNISRNCEQLDLKQCADLLYGSATLNYLDDILLEKICRDICVELKSNKKGSAVVGSILTSLGLVRYKDPIVLDALSEWIVNNEKDARPQDIFALFLTLAIVNHHPVNGEKLFKTIVPQLSMADTFKSTTWLDYVWSLIVLNQATPQHVESILKEDFVSKIEDEFSVSHKLKVLNINASADLLLKNYKGPKLSKTSSICNTVSARSKSKETLVTSVIETLSNFFPLETYLKPKINTGLGFYIDAECLIDRNGNSLPLEKKTPESIRVAVMVYDFYDMCRGKIEPTGISALFEKLLQAQGYKILSLPYMEYNPRDKLVQRVQYLKTKLKTIAQ